MMLGDLGGLRVCKGWMECLGWWERAAWSGLGEEREGPPTSLLREQPAVKPGLFEAG